MTPRQSKVYGSIWAFALTTIAATVVCGQLPSAPRDVDSPPQQGPATAVNINPSVDSSSALNGLEETSGNLYRGVAICSGCHSQHGELTQDVEERVCLTEFTTWRNLDRHSESHKSLMSERGARIGALMQVSVTDPSAGCVQCHTSAEQFAHEGVSCESCHGPSTNWLGQHYLHDRWLATSDDRKRAMGWIDVRSPVARSEVCLSCHVGSAEANRRITHAMYAAGHPPLAGFEIEAFADRMPRHWRYPSEKMGGALKSFDRTRNILVGSVVALRMAMELAVAEAAEAEKSGDWLDLARLECFACHHELKQADWRQTRPSVFPPGRPQLAAGCLPLVLIAAQMEQGASASSELRKVQEQLRAPFANHPFGDTASIVERGGAVVAWCRSLEQRLGAMDFTMQGGQRAAHRVLAAISLVATNEYQEYDTARQLFGAWVVVYGELRANDALRLDADRDRRLVSLLQQIESRDPFILERQQSGVPCAPLADGNLQGAPRLESDRLLSLTFENRKKYDPATFAKLMSELARLTRDPASE